MKQSELTKIVKEEIRFAKYSGKSGKSKGFFIPPYIVFKSSIKDQFKEHFKLTKGANGEYKLYLSPIMKVTLDQIVRGRPSSDYIKTTPELVKMVTERVPADVRGLLKKYTTKLNSSINMFPVEVKIAKVSDKGGIAFFNPSSSANEDSEDNETFGE